MMAWVWDLCHKSQVLHWKRLWVDTILARGKHISSKLSLKHREEHEKNRSNLDRELISIQPAHIPIACKHFSSWDDTLNLLGLVCSCSVCPWIQKTFVHPQYPSTTWCTENISFRLLHSQVLEALQSLILTPGDSHWFSQALMAAAQLSSSCQLL